MDKALLLLGGDLGEPEKQLNEAEARLKAGGYSILARSRDHWTLPWGFNGERLFLNRAIVVTLPGTPEALLRTIARIEADMGRVRTGKEYRSRTIDIDILLLGDHIIDTPDLQIPHPRMHQRVFALAPTADLLPMTIHPVLGRSILNLLNDLLATPPGGNSNFHGR